MAADELELKLKFKADALQYKKELADVRVQTAQQLAQIKTSVTANLNQARQSAAQSLAGIRQSAATNLGQARVTVANQLAQVRTNTAQQLAQIRVQTAQQLQSIRQNATQTITSMGSQFESAGRRMTVGLTIPLAALAAAAVKSARDIDAQVNTLRAFTGSTEAAEKRLAQLIATARKTPGLTTGLALQLDAQLRVARASEQAIDRILPAIGRLSAVQTIEDPSRFVSNLVQLVTTNFQKRDLRELVTASPLAGQVVAQLFNVDSPLNAEAIRVAAKRMGVTTIDAFATAFADAAAKNEGLSRVTESIGTRFDKLADRVQISLRPLGLAIIDALTPAVDAVVPLIESLGRAFASLPDSVKTTVVVIGGIAAAIGPTLFVIGSLLSTVGRLIPLLTLLNANAIAPLIGNLRLLGQIISGTAAVSASTATAMAVGWIALAAALAIAGVALYRYFTSEKQLAQVSAEQVKTTAEQVKKLQDHQSALVALTGGTARTADEQKKLTAVYALLDPEARRRVERLKEEGREVVGLTAELQKLIDREKERQGFQGVALATTFERDVLALRELETQAAITEKHLRSLEDAREQARGKGFADDSRAQQALANQISGLIVRQGELNDELDKARAKAAGSASTLAGLSTETGKSTASFFDHARALGQVSLQTDDLVGSVNRLAGAQGSAGAATAQTTTQVEEQVESLKQLKRALAEAEIAAKSRAEAAKRAFEEGRTSSAQYTREQIANAREREAASLKEVDAFLEAKRKELETADDKTRPKISEDIAKSELERKKIVAESGDEIANLQSAQRVKERDELQSHNEALISLARTAADEQIELLRAQVEKDESLRLANERKIVALEQGVTGKEVKELERRRDAVAVGTETRLRLEDELNQKLAEKKRQGAEQRRRIEEAEIANALRPVQKRAADAGVSDLGDQGLIERQRASLERSGKAVLPVLNGITKQVQYVTITSFENLEKAVKGIIDEGYARRIKILQDEISVRRSFGQNVEQLEAEKARLEQERVNAREQGDRAVIEGAEKDIDVRERQIRQAERLTGLERTLASVRLSVREAVLKATRVFFGNETELINKRYDIEAEKLKLALDAQLDQLDEEERADVEAARKTLLNKEEFEKEKTRIEAYYRALRQAAEDEARARDDGNERDRTNEIDLQDPNSSRSLFGDTFTDTLQQTGSTLAALGATAQEVFAQMSASAGNFTTIITGGLQQLVSGLGDMIENFLLVGSIGPAAFKKLAAGILAHYTATFAIKAIDNIAEGISNLAKASAAAASFNPYSAALFNAAAAQNFAAAAKYGIGAVATGVAAAALSGGSRGAAGNLADNGARGGGGSTDAYESERTKREKQKAEDDKYTRREDRRGESVPIVVQLIADGRELARTTLNAVRDGGDLQNGWRRATS